MTDSAFYFILSLIAAGFTLIFVWDWLIRKKD